MTARRADRSSHHGLEPRMRTSANTRPAAPDSSELRLSRLDRAGARPQGPGRIYRVGMRCDSRVDFGTRRRCALTYTLGRVFCRRARPRAARTARRQADGPQSSITAARLGTLAQEIGPFLGRFIPGKNAAQSSPSLPFPSALPGSFARESYAVGDGCNPSATLRSCSSHPRSTRTDLRSDTHRATCR